MTKIIKSVTVVFSLLWIAFSTSTYAGASGSPTFDCVDDGSTTTCRGSMRGARDSSDPTRYAIFAKMPLTVSGELQDVVVFQAVTNGQTRICMFSPGNNVTNDIVSALAPDENQYFVVEMPSGGSFALCSAFRAYRSSLYLP